MSHLNELPSLQEVSKWDSIQIQSLVRHFWEEFSEPEERRRQANWWLGLAQVTATKAFADNEPHRLSWAHIAVEIYEHLSSTSLGDSFERDLMFFKARFITKHEGELDERVGNAEEIIGWFWENLTVSLDEVQAGIPYSPEKLKKMSIPYIRQLRNVKNRLSILRYLKENNRLPADENLEKWLEIRDQLP